MPLIQITNLSIAYGENRLLDRANLNLDSGQRVGLLGRNGEGKSTLINIITGRIQPDEGEIRIQPGIEVASLEQSPALTETATVFDMVATGLGETGGWIAEYHALAIDPSSQAGGMERMAWLQSKLDACKGWDLQRRVDKVLSRLNLPANDQVLSLSGGWRRRVSLAQALVCEPQVLLLDEPTNHLDIESILWLEKQIRGYQGAVLFITHDREFLKNLATDIVDLERGKLTAWAGGYEDYLRRKAAAIASETRQNAAFDKKLAAEESWIRQGIQARRTRNEGRVRALQKLRQQRAERLNRKGNVRLQIDKSEQSGKLVIEADNIGYQYDRTLIVSDFSTRILRGDRIGLIGPNGIGKTTLLKLLLGQTTPATGTVRHGTQLRIAYFDQLRSDLNLEQTVIDVIGQGREQITINQKPRHVISYLSDFLFTPARARSPVGSLSGGERARVLLAKLFSKPTNLLVMDEPTNDLDIETLELLEDLLIQYDGTLLLVSHDRRFMDNVVTSTLAFAGNGVVREYVGGYSDWVRQRADQGKPGAKFSPGSTAAATPPSQDPSPLPSTSPGSPSPDSSSPPVRPKKKLGYREQRELASLPELIDELEREQESLNRQISEPGFYQQDRAQVATTLSRMKEISTELEQFYNRWSELEA